MTCSDVGRRGVTTTCGGTSPGTRRAIIGGTNIKQEKLSYAQVNTQYMTLYLVHRNQLLNDLMWTQW